MIAQARRVMAELAAPATEDADVRRRFPHGYHFARDWLTRLEVAHGAAAGVQYVSAAGRRLRMRRFAFALAMWLPAPTPLAESTGVCFECSQQLIETLCVTQPRDPHSPNPAIRSDDSRRCTAAAWCTAT